MQKEVDKIKKQYKEIVEEFQKDPEKTRQVLFNLTNQNKIIKQQMIIMLEARKNLDKKIQEHEEENKANKVYQQQIEEQISQLCATYSQLREAHAAEVKDLEDKLAQKEQAVQ